MQIFWPLRLHQFPTTSLNECLGQTKVFGAACSGNTSASLVRRGAGRRGLEGKRNLGMERRRRGRRNPRGHDVSCQGRDGTLGLWGRFGSRPQEGTMYRAPTGGIYFLGQRKVIVDGGRRVERRDLSLRGATARMAARRCWAWSKGREMRKRSALRAWSNFS
jgi:hypothetical protein